MIKGLSKPLILLFSYFPISLFRLIGMVGEACLPSNAYFPWTPDYTPSNMVPCLSILIFQILSICISFYDFPKYDFGMLTADSLRDNIWLK